MHTDPPAGKGRPLYAERCRGGLERIPASALAGLVGARRVAAPPDPTAPVAALYCGSDRCRVREVWTWSKYDRAPRRPPPLRCPGCNEPLELLGYVDEVPLTPVHVELAAGHGGAP
jgi:hypothetical protein